MGKVSVSTLPDIGKALNNLISIILQSGLWHICAYKPVVV